MKPNVKLAEAATPDGGSLTLHEHDGSFCIRLNGEELMNSLVTTSELLLGELATDLLVDHASPRVLIGGLGLGYTLRSVLDQQPPAPVEFVVYDGGSTDGTLAILERYAPRLTFVALANLERGQAGATFHAGRAP